MAKAKGANLTDKQAAFVREYCIDRCGTRAAISAGYSTANASRIAVELLTKTHVRAAIDALLAKLAEKTETEAEWVRRRLKEEADDFSELATHSGRIRALELVGKINGIFEKDNRQKVDPLAALLSGLSGNVLTPKKADTEG